MIAGFAMAGEERDSEEELREEAVEEEEKKRIVVLDSDEKRLDDVISALRKAGYSAVGVESASELLEVIGKQTPDLVITELKLRDMDGWELIFQLKFDNRYYDYWDLPIIVYTSEPITVETVKRVQAERIHDYLPKSLKAEELAERITRYFETREKIGERKEALRKALGYGIADEYERIALARRVRLRYAHALKERLERLREDGAERRELKVLQDHLHLENRQILTYEKRRMEIIKLWKVRTGAGDREKAKAESS